MSKTLECPVFGGNNPLTGEMIWAHRVIGGSEVIKDKLKSDYHWDGFSSTASTAAKLDEDGDIQEWQLHLFGKTKGSKFDASTFFLEQDEGNHVRIQEINLEKFVFKDCLVSEWLPPTKYTWEYRTPHESDPKKYYRVKEIDLPQYQAKPLWLRASCQVIPGPKLQVFLGCAPAVTVTELKGSDEKPFPLIFLEKFSVPFLPFEGTGLHLGLGPIPFLIDMREDLQYEVVATSCPEGQTIKQKMARFFQSAIKPNQRNEIKTWTKEVGAGSWVARSPNHTWPDPRPLAGDAPGHGDAEDNDDGSGQQIKYL